MSKIAIVLSPEFADWEYGFLAGTGGPFYGLDVRFFSATPGAVTSQGGLTVEVSQGTGEIVAWQPDTLTVIGGMVWESADAPDLGDLLRASHANGATIAGICGGTLALARAGLLNNVAHTSNEAAFLARNAAGYAGQKHYQESHCAVSADRIITAPGTAPVSFTAAVFQSAGLSPEAVTQFRQMMALEHTPNTGT